MHALETYICRNHSSPHADTPQLVAVLTFEKQERLP
jgi:hypothetical protein